MSVSHKFPLAYPKGPFTKAGAASRPTWNLVMDYPSPFVPSLAKVMGYWPLIEVKSPKDLLRRFTHPKSPMDHRR
jgi:hypothetical protein